MIGTDKLAHRLSIAHAMVSQSFTVASMKLLTSPRSSDAEYGASVRPSKENGHLEAASSSPLRCCLSGSDGAPVGDAGPQRLGSPPAGSILSTSGRKIDALEAPPWPAINHTGQIRPKRCSLATDA